MLTKATEEFLRLITSREAATRLAVSEKTLANWRCEGSGPPFVKISHSEGRAGAIRYSIDELTRWVQERTHTSTRQRFGGEAVRGTAEAFPPCRAR